MRKILLFSEQVFTVFTLLIYSGGLLILILSGGANETDTTVNYDTTLYQVSCILIYLITLFLLLLRWKKTIYVLMQNKLIWLLVGLSLFSILWSFAPAITLKDSMRLIGSSLFGVYLSSRYTLKQQLKLLVWMCGIAIVLSFIFAVALPKYGVMGGVHAGKWRGIFVHKNGLGASMLNSSILFLLMAVGLKKKRQFLWLGFGLSVLLLLLSNSTSALLNLAILIAVLVALRALWLPYYVMIPALIGIAIIGEIIYFGFINSADLIFGSLGKDSNLSGRGDLWSYVFDMIWKHPWLGYGYGGFWNGWNGESAYIWRVQAWTPTHPHNGFLALWLDLGLLGLSIFFLGFVINYMRALAFVRVNRKIEAIFPVIHMTALVLTNLTETALLGSDSIPWIMYIALASSIKIEMNEFLKKKNVYSIHQPQQNYLIQG
ncbi:O-antigen ligase family protein [Nostoc sp. 106C]|uniref:O-antigen ligase family protein n=1 Tax=Nostoc sp. 106C TaxID=1932667 RepID=UPI000A36D405|nr:O-antigen ligase family protein [Nostoc sp. 106C]OUL22566.1 polymerase [Nostoc sp. 106C]OUL27757.1 polymerase [Nostoc sp. RF31YmG]